MIAPYEMHVDYECPNCGNIHVHGKKVDHEIYMPVCSSCGHTGTIHGFKSSQKRKAHERGQ